MARTRSNIIVDSVKGTALGSAGAPALVSSRKSLRAAMALRGTPCEDRRTSADKAGSATHRRFSEEFGVCSTSGGMLLGAGGLLLGAGGVLLREISVREGISGDGMLGSAPWRNSRRFCPARKNQVVRRPGSHPNTPYGRGSMER